MGLREVLVGVVAAGFSLRLHLPQAKACGYNLYLLDPRFQ